MTKKKENQATTITPAIDTLDTVINEALDKNSILTLQTYYLSEYGQTALNHILARILERYNRSDLHDVLYTATKEIIMNGTKANLKRIIFSEMVLDYPEKEDYDAAMVEFKEHLVADKVKDYRKQFINLDYHVSATFYYTKNVINIKVKNNFPLFEQEEQRIREKFQKSEDFSNLIEFYMQHGDETEGAGLGLTMVGILLQESGIDRHCFTISTNEYNETAAKLEIPLTEDYIPKRKKFDQEFEKSYLTKEAFRKDYKNSR